MTARHDHREAAANGSRRDNPAERTQTRTATGVAALIAAVVLALAGVVGIAFAQPVAVGLLLVAVLVAWWARGKVRAVRGAPGE